MKIRVEPVRDAGILLEEWRVLFARAGENSVFLSPEWIQAWLGGAPLDVALWSVRGVAESSTELLGIAGVRKSRRPPILGLTAGHLHEFGKPNFDAIYIEYNDFLMSPDAPPRAREDAVNEMLNAFRVDELVFRNARPDLVAAAERAAASRGVSLRRLQSQPCFTINLDRISAAGERFLSTCSSSLRGQVRRSQRLYEERGPVTLHIAETAEERAAAWAILKELHEDGWRRRGEHGVFANPALVAFHERLGRLHPHAVELATVHAGGETIGCLYNLICGKRAFNYQSGFKFEGDNQLKPGMLAHALAAQHYLERGFTAYELLAGEAQYKRRLGKEAETLTTFVLERRDSIRAQARKALRGLRRGRVRAAKMHQT